MPKNWKTYKLSEVSELITKGTTPSTYGYKFIDKGINYIKSDSTSYDGNLDSSVFVSISEEAHEKLKRSQLQEDDILFSIAGAYLGKSGMVKKEHIPANTNQANAIIRVDKEKVLPKFINLLLRNPKLVHYINASSGQSAQPNLNLTDLGNLELNIPNLKEQTQIANILSVIDDKIENNLATNKTLEDMAMALYKHWFVDFGPFQHGEFIDSELGLIPEGWEVKRLEELSEIGSSKRIFRKEYVDEGVPFFRGKEVIQLSKGQNISTELFITEERFQEIKIKFGAPVKGDILISSVGTIGVSWLVDDTSEFYFKDGNLTWLKKYKTFIKGEFLHLWLNSNVGQEQIKGETIGSTQQALTISALRSLKLVIPSKAIYKKIESDIINSYNQTQLNLSEIETLTKLRDSLLPKLISGEVRLKEFREEVENLV